MKFKYTLKRTIEISPEILEEKIISYLINNSYRITERGLRYIIFTEDEFSDRKGSRSDFHTRIAEGKFIIKDLKNNEVHLELIYLTSFTYPIIIFTLVCLFGIYTGNITMPIVFSFAFTLPIFFRIYYLNEHTFNEILQC